MEELTVVDQPTLFSGEAQVSQEALERFKRQESLTVQGPGLEINTLFREKSSISIGEPIIFPLERLLAARGEKLPPDIQLQRREYEFYVVQLACTFRAASGCRFYDATFEFSLHSLPISNVAHTSPPISYDLAPQLIEDELKVSRNYHLKPEIKLDFSPIKAEASAIDYEHITEYLVYQGRIEAYGLQQSKAGWVFRRTRQHEVGQLQRLFAIVRKQGHSQVSIRFGLMARIEAITQFGPIGPIPLTIIFHRGDHTPLEVDELERLLD